ncbi:MAG: hypothetical protein AAGI51_05855 [Pseudomonadota bacterium]
MSKMNETRRAVSAAYADPYAPYLSRARVERSRAVRAAFAALARWLVGKSGAAAAPAARTA